MKSPKALLALIALATWLGTLSLSAQGTAFTYQGRLNDTGAAANGAYDLRLSVFDAANNGNPTGTTNTFEDVNISNGLFTVVFDPGANVFDANPHWLNIAVRPGASAGAFTNLIPRQEITPVPQAIFAGTAATAHLATAVATNAALTNVTASGTFSGNGSGLTSLNGSAIQNSTISSNAIAAGQVVKNLNGLTDAVVLASGNNIFLTTNGNTITIFTAPGLLSWIPTTNTSQPAAVNKGYLLTADALATVTLPTAPALADIIRVAGTGTNGWRIAQNANQSIRAKNLFPGSIGVTWTARDNARAWTAVAAADDGKKLVAAVNGGQLYTSADYGATWTARDSARAWSDVASSADGVKLVATVNSGRIYTSTNSGASWSQQESIRTWISVASSADGTILAAGESGGLNYISFDSGAGWTPFSGAAGGNLACSASGLKLVVATGGSIYTSTDSGATWTLRSGASGSVVASSADGTKLVAAGSGGQIYTSTDSGLTWTARDSNRAWAAVATSADGSKLVATVSSGQIYTSPDAGLTWWPHETSRSWTGIASSADGTKLAATVGSGQVFTSDTLNPVTTTGPTGGLLGAPSSAVELQYIGNNQFLPLSHEGFVTGF